MLLSCKKVLHCRTDSQYICAIMLIGYARVSSNEQDTTAQVAALKTSGCELIFREKASGGRWDRPELHKLLGQIRKGDVLVVWKLDRLRYVSGNFADLLMHSTLKSAIGSL